MRWRPWRTGLVGVAALLALGGGCGRVPDGDPLRPAQVAEAGPEGRERCEYVPSGEPARPVRPPTARGVPTSGTVRFVLRMTEGDVAITMDRVKAPCSVHAFAALAGQGFFDRTRCHRLADSGIFVLQCGDPTGTGRGGPGFSFADETDGTESYTAGVVALANSGPNTNGSQFFLVYDDSTGLDRTPAATIVGRMDERSRGVVARMAAEGQDGRNPDGTGVPNNPAEILTVTQDHG